MFGLLVSTFYADGESTSRVVPKGSATDWEQKTLRYDDIVAEENETVQRALKRLPPRLTYDRVYRQRRAMQCSLSHTLLPVEEWTKSEDVCHSFELTIGGSENGG
jgi:hypothetical protein